MGQKPKKAKLRALSLFTGAMGLDLGLERAGIQIVGCVEASPAAAECIRLNRPSIPLLERDISTVSVEEALHELDLNPKELDLVVGGPPCQAFSVFGRRRGLEDKRGSLIFEFVRFVSEIAPKAFIMENVRGLLSMKAPNSNEKGSLVSSLLREFNRVGYRVDVNVVNAINYGAPQIRERVILIGNRMGLMGQFPNPTHSDRPVAGQKPFSTLGDAIKSVDRTNDVIMDFSNRKKSYLKLVPPGGNWRSLPTHIQKESMGQSWYLKGGRSAYWRRLSYDFPCPTVVTMPNHAGTSMCHPEETRALSVRECAAVQEFPSDWLFVGSPGEQYKQVGNAVPVVLGRIAGEVVVEMLTSSNPELPLLCTENYEHHIRPHVRTRQYYKNGKTFQGEAYLNDQDRYHSGAQLR